MTRVFAAAMVTPLDSVTIIRRVFAAFARRDLAGVQEFLDPDVQFVAPTAELARDGEPYRGLDGMQEYFDDVELVWDELHLTPENFRQVDDIVLVTGRVWGRGGGQIVDSSAGWHWRLRDERVVYLRAFRSAPQAERALEEG